MPRSSRPARLTPARRKLIDRLLDELLDAEPEQRAEFMAGLARRHPRLHRHVDRLLEASTAPTNFLATLFDRVGRKALPEGTEECNLPPGTRIAGWRLVESIGAGGMGLVYRAERADGAFEMDVALKLIRRMDPALGRQLEIERSLLARLDHPGIARLIDGGVTDEGWAWLAMEWVPGSDLAAWVEQQRPATSERLRILEEIATAVGQAHRRMIVHGDIKPSNIRVTPGGRARLLDFGVARLIEEGAAGQDGMNALTPAFAAPEQKRGEPLTPQSDVYALGALAYWMLVGRSVTADDSATRARRMKDADPRGAELAAVVSRATHEDPDRRYPGVPAMIEDLERFRTRHPLRAMPASRRYRWGRYLARHRTGAALTALSALMLLTGVVGVIYQGRIAAVERDRAQIEARKAEQVSQYLVGLFEQADPQYSLGEEITARRLVEIGTEQVGELENEPRIQASLLRVLGQVNHALGDYATAESLLRRSLDVIRSNPPFPAPERARTLVELAGVLNVTRRLPEALEMAEAALTLLPEQARAERAEVLNTLGNIELGRGNFDASQDHYLEALALHQSLDPGGPGEALVRGNFGDLLGLLDRHDEAREQYDRAWKLRAGLFGETHPSTAAALFNLADSEMSLGNLEQAEQTYLEVLAVYRQLYGPSHPRTATLLHSLGIIRWRQDDLAGAEPYWQQALEIRRESLDPRHPDIGASLNALSFIARNEGRLDDARRMLEEVLEIARTRYGDPHYTVASTLHNLAMLSVEQGDFEAGARLHEQSLGMRRELLGADHSEVAISEAGIARMHMARGEPDRALEWAERSLATFTRVHGRGDHPEAERAHSILRELRERRTGDARDPIDNG